VSFSTDLRHVGQSRHNSNGARLGGHGHTNAAKRNQRIERDGQRIYLAGIDGAHYYRVDNIEKAATGIPVGTFSILLSHTPEVYQQASYADFSLLLCGHTHGGQICLPGRIPITLSSILPRHMGSGPWKYRDMIAYTSVGAGCSIVPVRFNCPPEITLHRLCPAR
jgi:predicted MPP superfamily phosphohydrolase